MNIGIIGLGKMGAQLAIKLANKGFTVYGFDPGIPTLPQQENLHLASSFEQLANNVSLVWLMVPAGKPVDDCLAELTPHLSSGSIIVDGGNSFYKDSMRRAENLAAQNIFFLDCGTSGGIHGLESGFSLMVGGDEKAFHTALPVFEAVAAQNGVGYFGPSGAGHFVKMVHNGIEYGVLQAYAEGFQILREGPYKNLDLAQVSTVWQNGSVVRSWILELCQSIFQKDQTLTRISGFIDENKTGRWTLDTAEELKIPTPVIKASLEARAWSRTTGGNFTTKLVAMLRNAFGGHAVKTLSK